MRRLIFMLFLTLLATAAAGQNNDLGFFPSTAPLEGGTEIEIYSFSYYRFNAPQVFFGDVPSPQVTVLSAYQIKAIAPAHGLGLVSLSVVDRGSRTELIRSFVYSPVLEEIIFPIAYKPIAAAHDTRWVSEISVYNDSDDEVPIDPEICYSFGTPFDCRQRARRVPAHSSMSIEPWSEWAPEPAMSLFPPSDHADRLHFTLRLRETSRDPDDPGIEIPVLRARDFKRTQIFLPAVTTNARFRMTVRVLTSALDVTVRIRDDATGQLISERSIHRYLPTDSGTLGTVTIPDPLSPAEARAHEKVRIEVVADRFPVWALITLTDNETQRLQIFTSQ